MFHITRDNLGNSIMFDQPHPDSLLYVIVRYTEETRKGNLKTREKILGFDSAVAEQLYQAMKEVRER